MDELLPPSAFANRSHRAINSQSFKFDSSFISPFNDRTMQRINESSQTEWIITANKSACTTEQLFSEDDLHSKISAKKDKHARKIIALKQQCQEEVSEMAKQTDEMSKRLSEVTREKNSATEELLKLKFYISGIENRDAWLEEKRRLIDEIDRLKYNVSEQQSLIDSLKVQLSSIEKIQLIQERELNKDIASYSIQFPKQECHYDNLLYAWRHKVLSLLVQQESANIVARNDRHHLKDCNHDLLQEIEHFQNELEQLNLRLDVNQAQLSSSEILIEKYKRENDNLHWQLQTMTKEYDENYAHVDKMCDQLNQFQRFVNEEFYVKFDVANSKIDTFQRRLDYASSRFPLIQANVSRRNNMTRGSCPDQRLEDEHLTGNNRSKIYQLEEALIVTNNELRILRQERDRLIVTLEEDSSTFYERLNQKKEEGKNFSQRK